METAAEIWNEHIRLNLIWVFLAGMIAILYSMRRHWREHWNSTGDDRFLGLNAEAFRLIGPLFAWLILFGIPATVADVVLGTK